MERQPLEVNQPHTGPNSPLTLHRDEEQAHELVDRRLWPDAKLSQKAREYNELQKDESLLPRQADQVNRILGWYVFELYSRGQERIKMTKTIKGIENEFTAQGQS